VIVDFRLMIVDYRLEGDCMDAEELKKRTKQLGLRIIKLIESLPSCPPLRKEWVYL
jgi:hypothetical protein